jgi:hypothetical protein
MRLPVVALVVFKVRDIVGELRPCVGLVLAGTVSGSLLAWRAAMAGGLPADVDLHRGGCAGIEPALGDGTVDRAMRGS